MRLRIANDIEAQLLGARWGIVVSLAVWGFVSLTLGAALGEGSFTVRGHPDGPPHGVVAVALVQGVGALLLACWIWHDSSPQRIEAHRQARLRRGSGEM
jgi:hypothetical protein